MIAAVFASCNNGKPKNLMPDITAADSAAVIYYDTPDNPRFFKYAKVLDMGSMKAMIDDVNDKAVKGDPGCATQGKVYFYGKGDAVYTVYFSDSCSTISFIVTGEKYYTQMSDNVKSMLISLEKDAKEPVSN